MNPLLLILVVFLLSPIAARLLHRSAVDEAQSIIDTVKKSIITQDNALFVSVFDESFKYTICGSYLFGYEAVKHAGIAGSPADGNAKYEIRDAKFTENGLMFVAVEQTRRGESGIMVLAKNVGGTYKVSGADILLYGCKANQKNNFY